LAQRLELIQLIPVSLYGVDEERLEQFYLELPSLVEDVYTDREYQKALFSITGDDVMEHLSHADMWAANSPLALTEDVAMEVSMALQTVKYPDVGMLEHLLTLDNVDVKRISTWMHFSTNIYPIYSQQACQTLDSMGLPTPFKTDDIASYGLYVTRIEGLKLHAPAAGMPEIGLPRARILQLGLERFK